MNDSIIFGELYVNQILNGSKNPSISDLFNSIQTQQMHLNVYTKFNK